MTGRAEWGEVRAPDGGIMGVYSLASDRPLQSGGFQRHEARFTGAESYRDWTFVYRDLYAGTGEASAARAH
jgi:hypothetical protein